MEKSRVEDIALPIFLVLDFVAVAQILVSYFIPYWLTSPFLNASYGLWFARVCQPDVCYNNWYADYPDSTPTIPRWDVLRSFETVAVISGIISLVFGVLMYVLRHRFDIYRPATQGLFFASALLSGFTALVGVLVFISMEDRSNVSWCPAVTAAGSFLAMTSGVFTLVVCRYDPYTFRIGGGFTIEQTAL